MKWQQSTLMETFTNQKKSSDRMWMVTESTSWSAQVPGIWVRVLLLKKYGVLLLRTHKMQLHNSPECNVQIPQHDNHKSSTEWWFYEKKSLTGMEIWTHNLVAHLFLPGHHLPYRDLHLSHISIGPYLHLVLWWTQQRPLKLLMLSPTAVSRDPILKASIVK